MMLHVSLPGESRRDAPSPSPAVREAHEDEGRRSLAATRVSALSDKDPAGRAPEPSTESVLCSAAARRASRSSSETKTAKLDVRLTQDERAAIDLRAEVLGVKPSAFARAAVLDALDGRRAHVSQMTRAASATPQPELATAVEQVRRLGVNLNQTLRRGLVSDKVLLRSVLDAVNEVRRVLGDRTTL